MAVPSWPSGLPYISDMASFQRKEHHRPAVVSETEDGPDLMRARSNTRVKKFSYGIKFTNAQYAVWETFVESTLVQGTRRFTMSVPVIGRTCVTRTCYIENAAWSDSFLGSTTWRVVFTLCVLPA